MSEIDVKALAREALKRQRGQTEGVYTAGEAIESVVVPPIQALTACIAELEAGVLTLATDSIRQEQKLRAAEDRAKKAQQELGRVLTQRVHLKARVRVLEETIFHTWRAISAVAMAEPLGVIVGDGRTRYAIDNNDMAKLRDQVARLTPTPEPPTHVHYSRDATPCWCQPDPYDTEEQHASNEPNSPEAERVDSPVLAGTGADPDAIGHDAIGHGVTAPESPTWGDGPPKPWVQCHRFQWDAPHKGHDFVHDDRGTPTSGLCQALTQSGPVAARCSRNYARHLCNLRTEQWEECGQEICLHGECWRCGYCALCMPDEDEE